MSKGWMVAFLSVGLSACSAILDQAGVGSVLRGPMRSPDLRAACASGEALGGVLGGLAHRPPHRALLVASAAGAMCSELRVWEAERDLAMRRLPLEVPAEVRIPAIRDARYALYDAHASAARRHHAAFLHFVAIFPQLAATDVCPKRPDDQVLMVLGLTSGLNAVLHDQAANGIEAVPLSIAHQVRTWSTCLDDTQWWGLPSAISAAVDITFPGGQPEEGWLRLSEAARKGDQAGVRLSRAFAMVVASMTGDESRAREELTAFRVSLETVAAPEAWALLDAYAYGLARQQSDLLWIQASGHRTPPGAVGQFP